MTEAYKPDPSWKRTIRLAAKEDLPEIWRMIQEQHSAHAMHPLSVTRVSEMFARHFERKGGIFAVVPADGVKAPAGGQLKGMIFLFMASTWYTTEAHWEELFVWVDPRHRKEKVAPELLKFAQWVSDVSGPNGDGVKFAPMPLLISILTNEQMEAKVRLYRRTFGPPAGASFVLNPSWKQEEPAEVDLWSKQVRVRGGREAKARRERAKSNGGAAHGADA
jgi:hypothetical protein